jgi:hypothetical protein
VALIVQIVPFAVLGHCSSGAVIDLTFEYPWPNVMISLIIMISRMTAAAYFHIDRGADDLGPIAV